MEVDGGSVTWIEAACVELSVEETGVLNVDILGCGFLRFISRRARASRKGLPIIPMQSAAVPKRLRRPEPTTWF